MEREDLGALLARIIRRIIDAETPILDRYELSMWEYVALTQLAASPSSSQLALAEAIRYDKTRLIALLDRLATAGLVTREPDPADRRSKVVRLTSSGRRRLADVQHDIRAMEDGLLAELTATQQRALLAALPRLAGPRPGQGA